MLVATLLTIANMVQSQTYLSSWQVSTTTLWDETYGPVVGYSTTVNPSVITFIGGAAYGSRNLIHYFDLQNETFFHLGSMILNEENYGVAGSQSVVVNDIVYWGRGDTDLYSYDLTQFGSIYQKQIVNLGSHFQHYGCLTSDGDNYIYIIGSSGSTTGRRMRIYNINTTTVTTATYNLQSGRSYAACEYYQRRLWIFGGIYFNTRLSSIERNIAGIRHDQFGPWSTLSQTLLAENYALVSVLNDDDPLNPVIFLIGGQDFRARDEVEIFLINSETIITGPQLNVPRRNPMVALITEYEYRKLWVMGGLISGTSVYSDSMEYSYINGEPPTSSPTSRSPTAEPSIEPTTEPTTAKPTLQPSTAPTGICFTIK